MAQATTGVVAALIQAAGNAAPVIAGEVARRREKREEKRAARRAAAEAANAPEAETTALAPRGLPVLVKVALGLGAATALIGGGIWAYRRFGASAPKRRNPRRRRRR